MQTETGGNGSQESIPAGSGADVKHGPILVTGSHRSGTTWVGRILSTAPRARLVHEPFNLTMVSPARSFDPKVWYRYIYEGNTDQYHEAIRRTLETQPYHHDLSRGSPSLRRTIRAHLAFAIRGKRDRVIYKDPLAFFSVPWLAAEFGMIPVVMIRHPAAFVSSVLLKNWRFNFTNFTRQPALMDGPLAPWRDEIARLRRKLSQSWPPMPSCCGIASTARQSAIARRILLGPSARMRKCLSTTLPNSPGCLMS